MTGMMRFLRQAGESRGVGTARFRDPARLLQPAVHPPVPVIERALVKPGGQWDQGDQQKRQRLGQLGHPCSPHLQRDDRQAQEQGAADRGAIHERRPRSKGRPDSMWMMRCWHAGCRICAPAADARAGQQGTTADAAAAKTCRAAWAGMAGLGGRAGLGCRLPPNVQLLQDSARAKG